MWDTVRADHLGLYSYARPTTPNLDRWAAGARVFEDCLSAAPYTLPSHASMFTGLLPSEHCTDNAGQRLGDEYTTLAEILRDAGYQTYLYSANPYVSRTANLAQGFDVVEHPWSPQYQNEAMRIVRAKLPEEDRSSELGERFHAFERGQGRLAPWDVKASGALAARAALSWLQGIDRQRPFFVFLNYMEAHRPCIPAREHRARMMSPEEVEKSYRVDGSWLPRWEYTFGLRDYGDEEIALMRATYDAALTELDDLFADLITALDRGSYLEDTIVVLTADHGEHLGEQHMLDHQYSVYQPLLRVPLIVRYPGKLPPGRDARPVMNFDLFPTLLELAGVPPAPGKLSHAVSLLRPDPARLRFSEDPAPSEQGVGTVKAAHPDWDPTPWQRRLRALIDGKHKLIWGSDERHLLFDLAGDPLETRDLAGDQPGEVQRLLGELGKYSDSVVSCAGRSDSYGKLPPQQLELLKGLGYVQ